MRIAICYVFPNTADAQRTEQAARFVSSYNAHGPGMDHLSIVVLNGTSGGGSGFAQALFASLPNLLCPKGVSNSGRLNLCIDCNREFDKVRR